jgi:hypothetical protein
VKRVKSVFGPLMSNYATNINKYTLKGNNKMINACINTMRSNRTSILRIDSVLIPLLGFDADNKKICATQPRLPKDLSISNVVTVRSFGYVPSKAETWGLRSRTSVAVEDDVADLKVVKNLARQL